MSKQVKIAIGNPRILGCMKVEEGYNFAVVSGEKQITLNLYRGNGKKAVYTIELDESYKFGDIFAVKISGIDFSNLEYNYGIGEKKVPDPYAKHVCDAYEFGQSLRTEDYRSRVMLEEFDWKNDRPLNRPYSETILYKLHVRGFTKHSSSGVRHKGTYEGVIEKIPYLVELGITAVELMPVFEFEEVRKWTGDDKAMLYNPLFNGRINYWGYCQGMYFAPKSAYAVKSRKNEDYTVEFKEMVKALHKAGIEVIVEMFFPEEAGLTMIRDCVRFWVVEYHIDGVHLNCSDAAMESVAKDPLLSRIKIFTPYWNLGQHKRSYRNLANYNQGFMNCARKLLKGDENQLEEFVQHVKKNEAGVAEINYITNNNGFTLMDLVSFDRKYNENNGESNRDGENFNNSWNCGAEGKTRKKKVLELRYKQMRNAFLMVMLSQGTPLILSGDEFGNSQNGNNNPYCQDNEVSWLNWKNLATNRGLFEYVKALIAFRKSHPILHMEKALRDMDYKSCGYPDVSYHSGNAWFASFENYNRHFGMMYCGKYAAEEERKFCGDDFIYVAYNLHWERHKLALPILPEGLFWEVVLDSAEGVWKDHTTCEQELLDIINKEHMVEVPERSITILRSYGKPVEPKSKKKRLSE
ncbi:MAG: alpha-amylase family glycosyl hydrolase [Lachnospiraceae bacterium]